MTTQIDRLIAERDAWRECAGRLYDELRVRGITESVSRSGRGCLSIFEYMDMVAENQGDE
jgi:hypothetical protein